MQGFGDQAMWHIDITTVLFLNGVTHVLLAAVTWLSLHRYASRRIALWCIATSLAGIGITLVGMGHSIPAWLSRELALAMVASSSMLAAQTLRLDLGTAWRRSTLLAYAMAYMVVHVLLSQYASTTASIGWGLLNLAFWLVQMAWAAWRLSVQWHSRSARLMSLLYAGFVLTSTVILMGHSGGPGSFESLLEPTGSNQFLHVSSYLLVMVSTLGYAGMVLDRFQQELREHEAKENRVRAIRERSRELMQLDRERNTAMLTESLARDLRPCLRVIRSQCLPATQAQPLPDQLLTALDQIVRQAKQASVHIGRLRQFLKPPVHELESLDLMATVQDVLKVLSRELYDRRAQVVWSKDSSPVFLTTRRLDVSQVILNLMQHILSGLNLDQPCTLHLRCLQLADRARLEILTGPDLAAASNASNPNWMAFIDTGSDRGLRLIVTQNIVEELRGKLWIGQGRDQTQFAVLEHPLSLKTIS